MTIFQLVLRNFPHGIERRAKDFENANVKLVAYRFVVSFGPNNVHFLQESLFVF